MFVLLGVLPFLMIIALVAFTALSEQFLTHDNLVNLLRQSVYLMLVAAGQMVVLSTGGFDLSVGTSVALTSVVSATVMAAVIGPNPGADAGMAVALGIGAGLLSGIVVGTVNGLGVAFARVHPFIMTLGVESISGGAALGFTGGIPVTGMPDAFSDVVGFGSLRGVPVPVLVTIVVLLAMYVVMTRLPIGTHFLAVGGNQKAAALSGIPIRRTLMAAYILCACMASVSGILLTARVNSGEATLGATVGLESVAACVIAGVSLRGGIARLGPVILGAIFITLVQNGMNLANVGAYAQMVMLGVLLILAVMADSFRFKLMHRGG